MIFTDLASGQTAREPTYFELNYTFYLTLIEFAPTGLLLYVSHRGLGAPGQYHDTVCGMRTDDSGPSITRDGETYYFCSNRCKQSFEEQPTEFAGSRDQTSDVRSSQGHEHQ